MKLITITEKYIQVMVIDIKKDLYLKGYNKNVITIIFQLRRYNENNVNTLIEFSVYILNCKLFYNKDIK